MLNRPKGKCNVCGKPQSELQPIDIAEIEKMNLPYPVYIYELTADKRLVQTYRGVNYGEQRVVSASWECRDCIIKDPDEIEKIMRG